MTLRYWAAARTAAGVAEDVVAVDGTVSLGELRVFEPALPEGCGWEPYGVGLPGANTLMLSSTTPTGLGLAALGLALHFVIAFGVVAVYLIATRIAPALNRRPLLPVPMVRRRRSCRPISAPSGRAGRANVVRLIVRPRYSARSRGRYHRQDS